MKRLCIGMILLGASYVYGADTNSVAVVSEYGTETTCFVSCPEEQGFPGVPKQYPCDGLPALTGGCTVQVYTVVTVKKDLQLVIDTLQVLAGLRKGE